MVRGTLVVDTNLLKDHFLRQQRGGNIAGYRGARMQRGYGIGGIFKSLARYAIPLLFKQGAKVAGKRALQEATEVGQDVLQGTNVREGEVNAAIYHQLRSKNWKKIQTSQMDYER
jgi:hypothetical protein